MPEATKTAVLPEAAIADAAGVPPRIVIQYPAPTVAAGRFPAKRCVGDTVAAQSFYEEVFGWTINPRPLGDFHQIVPGEGLHIGLFNTEKQTPDPDPKPQPARTTVRALPRTSQATLARGAKLLKSFG